MAQELEQAFSDKLGNYFRAAYPFLYVLTAEETRAEQEIIRGAIAAKRKIFVWSMTDGMMRYDAATKDGKKISQWVPVDAALTDPVKTLVRIKADAIKEDPDRDRVYILRDFHVFFGNPMVIRLLRDLARDYPQVSSTVLIMSPINKIPPELSHDAVLVELTLPDHARLHNIFETMLAYNKQALEREKIAFTDDDKDRVASAALGLTTVEAQNAFSKALIESKARNGTTMAELVMEEKAAAVKKGGILEYSRVTEGYDDIGGLEILKKWLSKRSKAFSKQAREYGLPAPRGILMAGLPGCGKSLVARAASSILKVPLIRFDVGRVFGSLVGESERQMREALSIIDAVGSCVVMVDEMEKALAGASGSGSGDSGTTRRVFGTLLTWMAEKTTPSFIIATVNSLNGMPPELLRKGRFDENFFVNLPSTIEREEILNIHLKKRKQTGTKSEVAGWAKATKGFSGAELEYAIVEGMYTAFDEGRILTNTDVSEAIKRINPISKSNKDVLETMIEWARENAQPAGIGSDDEPKQNTEGRHLKLS